jgi:hypothetical protein
MATLKNTTISDTGFYKPSTGDSGQRPGNSQGLFRYNTTTTFPEHNTGSAYVQGNKQLTDNDTYGSTAGNAALSGVDLKAKRPNAPSGYYWIKNSRMPNALQMYVNMTREGGGFDFYPITGGISVDRVYIPTNNWGSSNLSGGALHSGVALGLDLVYPRSQQHWYAIDEFLRGVLGSNVDTYFPVMGPIYRNTATSSGTAGGNYTSQIFRGTFGTAGGAQDWQVPDGGRWWLRDSTYSEPNGDYGAYGFLGTRGVPSPYAGQDIPFNDGGGVGVTPYPTGTTYLLSTNVKP